MGKGKDKSIVEKIWDFFASVKLAIIVFSAIGLTSIVGTILEQNEAPAKNIKILSGIVGESLAPGVHRVLDAMGFMNMYTSWWFVSLLLLFCSNLMICSLDRFPPILRLVMEPLKPLKKEHFSSFGIKRELRLKGKADSVKETIGKALSSSGLKYIETKEENGWQLYAQKGRLGRLGVYITHLSIIVIMMGALIGVFFGFKGGLNLPEGQDYPMAFSATGYLTEEEIDEQNRIIRVMKASGGDVALAASRLGVDEMRFRKRMKRLGIEPLGFNVRCEDFDVEFYGASDMAKEYTSHLTVTDKGRKVADKWIEVNSPLKYKGYTFYQSSYGMIGSQKTYTYILKATSGTGESKTYAVGLGEKITIPGTGIEASVMEFSPALSFDKSGGAFTYTELMNNPAARLKIIENDKENYKWILIRYPSTWNISGSNVIQFVDVAGAQYTGLQVRKDPGVWIVYLGCLIMSFGLYIAFFITHRKIWIMVTADKGSSSVLVSATAHKGRESFERKIDKMLSLLREGGK
jgi:cytochrome c biogenesis protein